MCFDSGPGSGSESEIRLFGKNQGPDSGAKFCSFENSFESSFEYFSNSFVKEVFKGAFKGAFKGTQVLHQNRGPGVR